MRTLAVLLVILAGCGNTAPSPSPALVPTSPSPTPVASPAAIASPTVGVTQPPPSIPPPSASDKLTDLPVEIHRVETDLTDHMETFMSLGSEIVWSGGATESDNDLYRLVPATAEPELVFANPGSSSVLIAVRGSTAGYVFVDQQFGGGVGRGWRLWFLALAGGEPVLLDKSTDDRLPTPTIAMDDSWIAWEVVHGTLNHHLNELRVASVADPLHPLTLRSFSGRDSYLAFPSLYGDELWYGIADNDWVANTELPRVEMIDLRHPAAAPVAFGAEQRAFMPAPGTDVVAWKSGGTDDLAALNAGTLTLYWRAAAQADYLPIPGPQRLAERISYPSVGERFVAWWDDMRTRLYVYDLADRHFGRILEFDQGGDDLIARPSLSGDLLAWLHYSADGERYLEWATLPD